jgi:hypothetical protein
MATPKLKAELLLLDIKKRKLKIRLENVVGKELYELRSEIRRCINCIENEMFRLSAIEHGLNRTIKKVQKCLEKK